MGFKIEGDLAASLLFTQYTKVFHSEQVAYYQSIPSTLETTLSNWNCVRPIAEMGLGLGWGTYLAKQKYHIDFLASYDFLFYGSEYDQKAYGPNSSRSRIRRQWDLHSRADPFCTL